MDDLEFVQRCVNGDKRSWDEFILKYSRLIYNYIHSISKVKGYLLTQENIEDLFQEIFLSLLKDNCRKLYSFQAKNGCSLASWLRQVTINFTIDYIRKLKPLVSIDEEDDEGFSLARRLPSGSSSARDTLSYEERFVHLKDCIEKSNNNDKLFLELHIQHGLSLEDLKSYFKVSRGTVDMRKSRLMERLRDCFKEKGFILQ